MTAELVRVGEVVKPHGIRGEIVVDPVGETLASLEAGSAVFLGVEGTRAVLVSSRPHKGRWLVLLDCIEDRTAAERWRGSGLFVTEAQRVPLSKGEVWADDLVGYRVSLPDGRDLGVVLDVVVGAQDLLKVDTGRATVLVPMVRDWLVELSPADRCMVLDLPNGLLEVDVMKPGS